MNILFAAEINSRPKLRKKSPHYLMARQKSVRSSISDIKTPNELKLQYGSFQNDPLFARINKKIDLRPKDDIDNRPSIDSTFIRGPKTKRNEVVRSETRKYRIRSALKSFSPEATLYDMSRISEESVWFRRMRSRVYSYLVPLMTMYYFVPAVQISFLSRQPQDQIGSRDLCYHNFRCSIPFYIFSDFNHIVSNMSYFLFGLAFIFLVWQKQRRLLGPEECSKGKFFYKENKFKCRIDKTVRFL